MTKRDALILALKIFGVWLLVHFIMYLPIPFNGFRWEYLAGTFLGFFPWLALAAIGYLLVRRSEWVAREICRMDESPQVLSLAANKEDVEEIAFVVIGIYVFAFAFPQLGSMLSYLWFYTHKAEQFGMADDPRFFANQFSSLVRIVIQMLLGLYFILGARGLVNLTQKARSALVWREKPRT